MVHCAQRYDLSSDLNSDDISNRVYQKTESIYSQWNLSKTSITQEISKERIFASQTRRQDANWSGGR